MGALETEAKPSSDGTAGASRPPFTSRIEVDAVTSVREEKVDVKPHHFHCLTGIMLPGGEELEPYMVSKILDSEAGRVVQRLGASGIQRFRPRGSNRISPFRV